MTALVIVLIGLILIAAIVVVDLKALRWIDRGGLRTGRRRFFVVYLPLAVWVLCYMAPIFTTYPVFEEYLWLPFRLLGYVYGIAFTLHYFRGDFLTNDRIRSLFVGCFIVIAMASDTADFLRVNTTPSMPRGVYTLSPVTEKPLRGDLVTFCLESNNAFVAIAKERGYAGDGSCPTGLQPLLKVLAGVSGDTVETSPDGIILNGSFLAGTARPEVDSKGRTVPPSLLKNGSIPSGQALVISQEHSGSFDSRHFGLVPYDSLQKVSPLLIYKEKEKNG